MMKGPLVCAAVSNRCANSRTVKDALVNHRWVSDVSGQLGHDAAVQCLRLFMTISTLDRDLNAPDEFSWPWSSSGQYSARSTYNMFCFGFEHWEGAKEVWRSWAPLKCKLFAWLAI